MVPGILVILVTIMCTLLCSINIVREKEVGTIEQINVTPVKKHLFILGKLIPFWIIGLFEFSLGLFVVGRLVYGIIPVGSVPVLYSFLALYLIAMLGFGLLLSTFSSTQQQAMSMAFFFIMIFILMSGLFTAIENMPGWAQVIARCNPVTYFMEVVRMIILKGSGFADIKYQLLIVGGFALTFNTCAVLNYRKAG
jgi:ABC-2 type transport system permease protein